MDIWGHIGVRLHKGIERMENQVQKNMEDEMGAGEVRVILWLCG